jgi:hypothetical protein
MLLETSIRVASQLINPLYSTLQRSSASRVLANCADHLQHRHQHTLIFLF